MLESINFCLLFYGTVQINENRFYDNAFHSIIKRILKKCNVFTFYVHYSKTSTEKLFENCTTLPYNAN